MALTNGYGSDLYQTGAVTRQPTNPGSYWNFSTLQRAGVARPAPSTAGIVGAPASPYLPPQIQSGSLQMPTKPALQPGTPAVAPAPPSGNFGMSGNGTGMVVSMPPGGLNGYQWTGASGNNNSAGIGSELSQRILDALNRPSRYDSQQAQDTFNRLNATLTQGFKTQRQLDDEEMARRGLFSSTIAQGRMGDRDIQMARAQSDLAGQIAERQASTYQTDLASAIAQAMGYGQNQFNNQLQTAQFNSNLDNQYVQQLLATLGITG